MIKSPTDARLAADPLTEMIPLPRWPRIAYVTKRSPLLMFQTCTCSFSTMLAASRRSSSIAHAGLPHGAEVRGGPSDARSINSGFHSS